MITYILIGLLFAIGIELVMDWLKKIKLWPYKPGVDPFNFAMRTVIVLFWPLGLMFFLGGFIKSYFKL
jgi:membrane-bound metal-dependent hydrolase YbcI (DUF457 family)